jgi:general L-amino acid transport system permease protein
MAEITPRTTQGSTAAASNVGSAAAAQASFFYRPEVRQVIYQVIIVVALVALFGTIISNTIENMRRLGIASGFGFWNRSAGFDIGQTLIEYSAAGTYGRAFWVGVWNTVLIAAIGIFVATILGFIIGVARLSTNWLVARMATVYVEVLRNIPLLLQLIFWYFTLVNFWPQAKDAKAFPGGGYLSNRGLTLPEPVFGDNFTFVWLALLMAICGAVYIYYWARDRRLATGQTFPTGWVSLGLIVGLPLLVFLAVGRPLSMDYPIKGRFNLTGGFVISSEFMALLLGLSLYTASFIAEIVRAGILAVTKGQKEAAAALGLQPTQALRLVVIPQAMRIVIPPLTSQYLNLTKNSSLGLAIAYPDVVSVTGTMLNQTGQAVELILLTMLVYLTISLLTSAFMNWFNARVALVER